MKSRTLWLRASILALLAAMTLIGSIKFRAQEKRKDDNPAPIDTKATQTEAPQWADMLDHKTLATFRSQQALQPAIKALHEARMKSPGSGFASVAFERDGLSLYWKGQLDTDMLAAINKAREFGPVEIVPAAFSLAEMEAEAEKLDKVM